MWKKIPWEDVRRLLAATCGYSSGCKWPRKMWKSFRGRMSGGHLRPATCGHLRPLEWLQVAAIEKRMLAAICGAGDKRMLAAICGHSSGCKWLQVAASGCKWLQVAASGCKWLQVAAGNKRMLAPTCGHSSGCKCLLFPKLN